MGRLATLPIVLLCGKFLVIFLLRETLGQSKQREGRVCARNMLRIPLAYNETYAKPQHQPYLTLCPGPRVCSSYRTTYQVATRQVRKEILQAHIICCPGWKKRHLGDTKCEEAICHKSCQNGGSCIQPNKCQCPPGWGGRYCQIGRKRESHRTPGHCNRRKYESVAKCPHFDHAGCCNGPNSGKNSYVDECGTPAARCAHDCLNTAGSYKCQCRAGYTLQPDGKSCLPTGQAVPLLGTKVQTLGIQETIPNEIQELQAKVEQLEERLEHAISILPTSVEPTQMKEMWNRLRYLDHVESLSEQLLFLEEKLGDCACQNDKNGFGYDLAR